MGETEAIAVADLEEWVERNADTFDWVARASCTSNALIHLAAVLVKSGLSDEQIVSRCEALVPRFGAAEPVEVGLPRALPLLRAALEREPDGTEGEE